MVNISNDYISRRNLKFGTDPNPKKSKTKCMIYGRKLKSKPKNIVLDGNALPWVNELKHLGCSLQSNNSMGLDISLKRCQYNDKVNSILQEFHSSQPQILLKCITSFATSFTGSQLWDLFSNECERLYKSWNVTIRQVFNLDRKTQRSLIEPISGFNHLKTMLIC